MRNKALGNNQQSPTGLCIDTDINILYIDAFPSTHSCKSIYTDIICLTTQAQYQSGCQCDNPYCSCGQVQMKPDIANLHFLLKINSRLITLKEMLPGLARHAYTILIKCNLKMRRKACTLLVCACIYASKSRSVIDVFFSKIGFL